MKEITSEDWTVLCRVNPLAEAQMESIVLTRIGKQKDARIAELERQLQPSQNGSVKAVDELDDLQVEIGL